MQTQNNPAFPISGARERPSLSGALLGVTQGKDPVGGIPSPQLGELPQGTLGSPLLMQKCGSALQSGGVNAHRTLATVLSHWMRKLYRVAFRPPR